MASFDPNSRVIEYFDNCRDNSMITLVDKTKRNKTNERPKIIRKINMRVTLKKRQLNLKNYEALEVRCMRVDSTI
jgi:hypothetical protein